MTSQARQVSSAEYWKRRLAAVTGNDVYALAETRLAQLWYATPHDAKIALLEEQIAFQKARVWRFLDSARRWQFSGKHDRCADQVKYARQCRKSIAGFRLAIRETIAERDQEQAA